MTLSCLFSGQYDVLFRYIETLTKPDKDTWGNVKYYMNIVKGDYFIINRMNHSANVTLCMQLDKAQSKVDPAKETEQYLDLIEQIIQTSHCKMGKPVGKTGKHQMERLTTVEKKRSGNTGINEIEHLATVGNKDLLGLTYEEFLIKQIIQHHQLLREIKCRVSKGQQTKISTFLKDDNKHLGSLHGWSLIKLTFCETLRE